MVLHREVYDKFAKHDSSSRKGSQRFREIVSQLLENKSQQEDLRRFYRRHSEFFDRKLGNGHVMELYVSRDIRDRLTSLAFDILRQGNVSMISRILMYDYAVKTGWIKTPRENKNKTTVRHLPHVPPGKIIPIGPQPDKRSNRRLSAFAVDTLFTGNPQTKRDLEALGLHLQLSQSATVRHLIEKCSEGNTYLKIRRFYYTEWEKQDRRGTRGERIRYRNTRKLDSLLDRLTTLIIGENNRSRALRAIVAWCAVEYGLRKRQT